MRQGSSTTDPNKSRSYSINKPLSISLAAAFCLGGVALYDSNLHADFTDTINGNAGTVSTQPINDDNGGISGSNDLIRPISDRTDGVCAVSYTPNANYDRVVITRRGSTSPLFDGAMPSGATPVTVQDEPGDSEYVYYIQYYRGNWAGPMAETTCAANKISATIASKVELVKDNKSIGQVSNGDTIRVTYFVANTGNTTLNPATIKDEYFNGRTVTMPTTTVLKPGEKGEYIVEYVMKPDDLLDPIYSLASATLPSKTPLSNGVSSVSVTGDRFTLFLPIETVDNNASLDMSSSIVTDRGTIGTLDIGDVVKYSWKLTNTGNEDLSNPALSSVELGSRGVAISTNDTSTILKPGQSINYTATYTVKQRDLSTNRQLNINAEASEDITVCQTRVACGSIIQLASNDLPIAAFPSPIVDDFNYKGVLSDIPKTLVSWENIVGSLNANGASVPNSATTQVSTIDTPGSDFDQSMSINADGTGGVALVGRMSDKDNYIRARAYKNNYYYDPPGYWTQKWVEATTVKKYSDWSPPYAPNYPLSEGYCASSSAGYVVYYDKDYKPTSEDNAWYKHTYVFEYYSTGGSDGNFGCNTNNPYHFRIEIQSRSITDVPVPAHYENDQWIDPAPITDYNYHVVTEKVEKGQVTQLNDYRYGASPVNRLRFRSSGDNLQVFVNGAASPNANFNNSFNKIVGYKSGIQNGLATTGNKSSIDRYCYSVISSTGDPCASSMNITNVNPSLTYTATPAFTTDTNKNGKLDEKDEWKIDWSVKNTSSQPLNDVTLKLSGDIDKSTTTPSTLKIDSLVPDATQTFTTTVPGKDISSNGSYSFTGTISASSDLCKGVCDGLTQSKTLSVNTVAPLSQGTLTIQPTLNDANGNEKVDSGETISYQYTFTNTGDGTVKNITPGGEQSIQFTNVPTQVKPGETVSFTGTHVANANLPFNYTVNHNIKFVANYCDASCIPTEVKNTTNIDSAIPAATMTTATTNATPKVNESVVYSHTVKNTSPYTMTNVYVEGSDGTSSAKTGLTLAPGATATIKTTSTKNATGDITHKTFGTVAGSNREIAKSTTKVAVIDFDILSEITDTSYTFGDTVTISNSITNNGDAPIDNVYATVEGSDSSNNNGETILPGETVIILSTKTITAADSNIITRFYGTSSDKIEHSIGYNEMKLIINKAATDTTSS